MFNKLLRAVLSELFPKRRKKSTGPEKVVSVLAFLVVFSLMSRCHG